MIYPKDEIGAVRDEADLDSLITRIQSDLRAGRSPADRQPDRRDVRVADHDGRFGAEIRRIRERALRRAHLASASARWLVPALIFLTVLAATLAFDRP